MSEVNKIIIFIGDGLGDRLRVDAVELDGPERLALVVLDEPHGLRRAFDERTGGDHLADVEAGTVFAAQATKRRVCDARHRRKYHGHVKHEGANAQSRVIQGCGRHMLQLSHSQVQRSP